MTMHRRLHYADVVSLPRIKRLTHHKTTKHLTGVLLGICLMLTGSVAALNSGHICSAFNAPHAVVDAFAYFIHGFGSLPVLKHMEPLWYIFISAE